MKRVILLMLLAYSYVLCIGQATTLVVDNQTPGWLSSKINYGDQLTVESLKINGFLNPEDLKFIGTLINSHSLKGHLNLEDCQIIDKTGSLTNVLEENCFDISYSPKNTEISKISMPVKLVSSNKCISEDVLVDTLVIGGDNMSTIGYRYFQGTTRGQSHHKIKNFIIREGVTQIGEKFCYKVDDYIDLQAVSASLPNTLKKIGKGAFENCTHLSNVNLPNTIETIELDAFRGSVFLPDTLFLPNSLLRYNTTAFPIKNGQVVMIPESVTSIDNTYQTYYNMTNTWTTHDYIQYYDHYVLVMNSMTPPSTIFKYEGFLQGSTIYVPKGSYSDYSSKKPFSLAKLIEIIPIEEISFSSETLSIFIDETIKIKPIITPSNATIKDLIWTSINPEIATVDYDGNIQGVKYGQTIIKVTTLDSGKTASFNLNVYEHITSVSLPSHLSINIGENSKIIPEILPINKNNGKVSWNSSDENIATVDENGNVKGISKGKCTISVTTLDGGFTAICEVSVIQPVESVSVSSKQLSLMVGESQIISATVYPANADDKTVSWASSNEEVATVTNDGKVTAIGPGNAKLYVISNYNNHIKDSCDITVLQPVTGVNLDSKEIELIVDESIKLNAQVLPVNASNKGVNWTSSDISVAMVSPDGTVYGIKPGQATIMATTVDGGFVALCKVTVKSKIITISSLSLSEDSATLAIGETLQLNAIISPANATTQTLKWSSINPNIASVDANGLVKAITEGTTQVIATTTDGSNLSALCEITVKKQFVSISSIQIVPNSFEMTVGQNGLLEVEITPTDATNKSVTWSSTNPSVVTVTQDGAVQAHSEGKVVIIASTKDGSNLSAICSVSVKSESGVETITIDNDTQVKIYSLSGVLLYEGLFSNCRLKPDFYIIIHNGYSYKIKITQ